MSTMTLGQVRDWLQNCADSNTESSDIRNDFLGDLADAIDAELKARGEPIAWIHPSLNDDHPFPDECLSTGEVDGWLPLYTAPPEPKIEVTDAMVEHALRAMFVGELDSMGFDWRDMVGDWGDTKKGMCRALEAALKGTP